MKDKKKKQSNKQTKQLVCASVCVSKKRLGERERIRLALRSNTLPLLVSLLYGYSLCPRCPRKTETQHTHTHTKRQRIESRHLGADQRALRQTPRQSTQNTRRRRENCTLSVLIHNSKTKNSVRPPQHVVAGAPKTEEGAEKEMGKEGVEWACVSGLVHYG
jgi:hypothetical protein